MLNSIRKCYIETLDTFSTGSCIIKTSELSGVALQNGSAVELIYGVAKSKAITIQFKRPESLKTTISHKFTQSQGKDTPDIGKQFFNLLQAQLQPDEEKASELNNQGYDLAEKGRWAEAIPYYQKALQHNTRNVHALTNLGNALQALGHLDEALEYHRKALEIDPDNALAWANKAVVLSGLGRRPEAIQCYDRSLQIDPFNRITWFNKGSALYFLERYMEAIKCFDHILEKLDPKMKGAWGAKSNTLKALGKYNEALRCLDRILEIDADDPQVLAEKASLLVTSGQPEQALPIFDKALRQNPKIAVTWYNKGHALHMLKRYEEAIECYDRSIELDPEYARAWGNKAAASKLSNKPDQALQCIEHALQLDPSAGNCWHLKGMFLYDRNRFEEALLCFKNAHELKYPLAIEYMEKCRAKIDHLAVSAQVVKKQLRPVPPRQLIAAEALVLFALDAKAPPVDDSFFDDAFQSLTSQLPEKIWMGSWKVLRIPRMKIVATEKNLQLPELLLEEMQSWENAQSKLGSLRITKIFEFAEVDAYAFVICYVDG